jgi:hypothetical protein
VGDDHIDVEIDEFRQQRWKSFIVAISPAILNDEVFALLIAQIAQAAAKCLGALWQAIGRRQTQKSNPEDLSLCQLRARRQRPTSRCAAENRDELAALHLPLKICTPKA